jgi:hypothetical protein
MQTEIRFLEGENLVFDETAEVKMTQLGVEITERDGEDTVRVLFPWARVERVTQRGVEVSAIYHY